MKLAVSDAPTPGGDAIDTSVPAAETPVDGMFAEGEHETRMAYGHGRLPIYIVAAWVAFLIGYVVYFWVYGWPDLVRWGAP
jgi:hypothetical protein